MRKRYFSISNFHCKECGSTTPLARYGYREKGHIKDIWCYQCKKITKHLEQRYDELVLEENDK